MNEAETASARLCYELGLDFTDPDLIDTPLRFVRALAELTRSVRSPDLVESIMSRQFDGPDRPQMIHVTGVEFTSVCEHHLLPFFGEVSVAYLPERGAKVIGVSKLPRLVEAIAARPMMQERLGEDVIACLEGYLSIQGAGVVITGNHTCMTLRGVRSRHARMVTTHLAGVFLEGTVRAEFLTLARPATV
jgi:GTP cyclohydrolase I